VKRVASITALIPLLAIAGFAYGTLLQENFPYNGSELVFTVVAVLGLASLICLAAFAGLLTIYRKKLNRLRHDGRQLVTSLLESRLGKPHIAPLASRPPTGPAAGVGTHRLRDAVTSGP